MIVPLLFQSCGALFSGTSQTITFDSNVDGATVEFDGLEVGETPHTQKVKKSFDGLVTISAEGYAKKSFELARSFNTISVLNLFSIFHWGIDLITGGMYKFDQKSYDIKLKEDKD
tara:strand:+ start:220 stop:564 length:345 start_codon:yes stop_codon:yes gene_type:complete